MGKRKKNGIKKGAIPYIFNVPFITSGKATCEFFRKELFGEPQSKLL